LRLRIPHLFSYGFKIGFTEAELVEQQLWKTPSNWEIGAGRPYEPARDNAREGRLIRIKKHSFCGSAFCFINSNFKSKY